jgi:glyoxylase-like metal-dependent hydrolase (beta-lactamase superfamily II)
VSSSTHDAVSPDSGLVWDEPGAWPVADGLWRVPLPLPNDGLRAVNVYVLQTEDGLTLIDGGWAIEASRTLLERSLVGAGFALGDIRRFLVTHVHRDHYTQAVTLRREVGAHVALGAGEKPSLDAIHDPATVEAPQAAQLRAAGAPDLAAQWMQMASADSLDPSNWEYPDAWLSGGERLAVGARTLTAVHTPGHTRGHVVFHDEQSAMLFAGDHVLPTITPSIGFEGVSSSLPLADFLDSLARVRALPDARLLPAHGPVAPSVHARVDELVAHHERRLGQCAEVVEEGPVTALQVAGRLGWTRRERPFETLDPFNAALAVLETRAHLELLAAQGRVGCEQQDGVAAYSPVGPEAGQG